MKYYALDTETTTQEPLEAYLCGVCEVYKPETFWWCDNVPDLVEYMFEQGGCYYAHNLKFDYSFLYPYLVSQEYKIEELITGREKKIRSVDVTDACGRLFTLRDSYAIFSAPLKSVLKSWNKDVTEKDDVEYYATRPEKVSEKFFDYFRADVVGLAEALNKRLELGRDKLTTSGDSKAILKEIINDEFRTGRAKDPFTSWFFTPMSLELDTELRKWYRGGFCYVNPEYRGELLSSTVTVYDINSMYPAVMENEPLPYGEPRYFSGKPKGGLFVVKIEVAWFSVKENCAPFITNGSKNQFLSTEYVGEASEDEPVEKRTLFLTSPELALFLETYEHGEIVYHYGYYFKSRVGLLGPYVEKYRSMKQTETGAMREFAKLMLNAPSGKFGENPLGLSYHSVMRDGVQRFEEVPEDPRKPFYLPMSIFITASARCLLLRQIAKVGADFVYCDTDSVHCLGDHDADFDIDPVRFGAWKKEGTFERSKYLRTKRYAHENGGKSHYTCAGIKSAFIEKVIDSLEFFEEGLTVPVRRMKMFRGGMCLVTVGVSI